MSHPSEPFYFESAGRQIFGLYHPAIGPNRGEGIVFCYPAPQEIMRSYQAHVQLSQILARLGYAVLRFDYSATGDSDGFSKEASLEQWEVDTMNAVNALKRRAGVLRASLLGSRLGGAIALRVSSKIGVKQLILWDPIIDGINYLQTLESSHGLMLRRNPIEPPFNSSDYRREQCLGFAMTATFRKELAAISPPLSHSFCKKIHLVSSEMGAIPPSFAQQLSEGGAEVQQHLAAEPMHWADDRYVKIRAFPIQNLSTLSRILGGT